MKFDIGVLDDKSRKRELRAYRLSDIRTLGFMCGLAPNVIGLIGIHVVWIGTKCRRASWDSCRLDWHQVSSG